MAITQYHYLIQDRLQTVLNLENYSILRTLILVGFSGLLYFKMPTTILGNIVQMVILIMVLRFLLSEMTIIKELDGDGKQKRKLFGLSGHIAIFSVLVIIASERKLFYLDNRYFAGLLILLYGLFNVFTKDHTTNDMIFTFLIIYLLNSMSFIKGIAQQRSSQVMQTEVSSII